MLADYRFQIAQLALITGEQSVSDETSSRRRKLLTNQTAELERVRSGIGLPTRSDFYEVRTGNFTGISPYFSMDSEALRTLVRKAFRRSDFDCYSQFSHILSYYLQRIIEIPDRDEDEIRTKIQNILKSMNARMEFMRSNRDCSKCLVSACSYPEIISAYFEWSF